MYLVSTASVNRGLHRIYYQSLFGIVFLLQLTCTATDVGQLKNIDNMDEYVHLSCNDVSGFDRMVRKQQD